MDFAVNADMIGNPNEPHLPCVLLLDTSGSMGQGEYPSRPIDSLNHAIEKFIRETQSDGNANKCVDLALISFNDSADVQVPFTPLSAMQPVTLEAGGLTNMAQGIHTAIDIVKNRLHEYASMGTPTYKPWIFMITDGLSTSSPADMESAADRIRQEEAIGAHGKLKFWALGVPGADEKELTKLSKRVLSATDTDFSTIFNWLSQSMSAISVSSVMENAPLPDLPQNMHVIPTDLY